MGKQTRVETTFGSIEGAAEYLALLLESVNEAREDLAAETALASAAGEGRREQAIQLATYKLSQLKQHLTTSHRLLNDLRTIRRLLFAERQGGPLASEADTQPGQFVTTAAPISSKPVPNAVDGHRAPGQFVTTAAPISSKPAPNAVDGHRAPGRGPRPPA